MARNEIRLGRVYDQVNAGFRRVLVDRLWPRGLSKKAAQIDDWLKDVAPSAELRTWFAHDPDKFPEFRDRYRAELAGERQGEAFATLSDLCVREPLIILTATKNVGYSHACILVDLLGSAAQSGSEEAGKGEG